MLFLLSDQDFFILHTSFVVTQTTKIMEIKEKNIPN